jgi:hypothetical protein
MHNPKKLAVLMIGLLLLAILASCSQEPTEVTRIVEVDGPERIVEVDVPGPEVEVEVTRVVEVEVPAEVEMLVSVIPFEQQWASSPHNDASAEAFRHWDEEDPQEIPPACARCHSTSGYQDWIGADGTEAGVVDVPAPIGSTVECAACHNDTTLVMTSVTFPSGVTVDNLGDEARCMQCHQGRHSTVSVNESVANAGLDPVADIDTVSEDLGFSNIHYYAAAATQYGTITMGGYEYEGRTYDSRFEHVEGYNTCIGCHDPHTLEVKIEECSGCHEGVETVDDLVDVRMPGSLVDYDGDGDEDEGIYYEIEGLRAMLAQAMTAYSGEVIGTAIGYNGNAYPYFFVDTNGDGMIGEDETDRYNAWTPRLAYAAYNYQVSLKDPGRFAHGGKYIIQLLFDSIASLNEAIAVPVDLSNAHRIDHGHFAGSEEAFRHWDEDGAVPGSCSRCHSAAGLPLFLEEGVSIEQPTANGLNCATCHNDLTTFSLRESDAVPFPSGAVLTLASGEDPEPANLCINCHQGRESGNSVDRRIGDAGPDEVAQGLGFVNIHYLPAGATLFGTEAGGGYEYDGQTYEGRNTHVGKFDTCIECHSAHRLEVQVDECAECHEVVTSFDDLHLIRGEDTPDFDGDGNVEEGLYEEVVTMREVLYEAIVAYTANTEGLDQAAYNGNSYPYFFIDADGDGVSDGDRYVTWTPRLMRAAYNFQYASKDPGGFAHNGRYMIQLMYDSIRDLGGDVSGMTRP